MCQHQASGQWESVLGVTSGGLVVRVERSSQSRERSQSVSQLVCAADPRVQ